MVCRRIITGLMALATSLASTVDASDLTVKAVSDAGEVLKNAVIYALPKSPAEGDIKPVVGIVDQRDKEFIPDVLPIQVGTAVQFPNSDKIRHHVYSFSPAKSFEIPLYAGTPPDPIVFDKPGPVSLGCNIHDWMGAFVFVVDTPYFALTDDSGTAVIKGIPDGDYTVMVWHPRMKGWGKDNGQEMMVGTDGIETAEFKVALKKAWRAFRAPAQSIGGYR